MEILFLYKPLAIPGDVPGPAEDHNLHGICKVDTVIITIVYGCKLLFLSLSRGKLPVCACCYFCGSFSSPWPALPRAHVYCYPLPMADPTCTSQRMLSHQCIPDLAASLSPATSIVHCCGSASLACYVIQVSKPFVELVKILALQKLSPQKLVKLHHRRGHAEGLTELFCMY